MFHIKILIFNDFSLQFLSLNIKRVHSRKMGNCGSPIQMDNDNLLT